MEEPEQGPLALGSVQPAGTAGLEGHLDQGLQRSEETFLDGPLGNGAGQLFVRSPRFRLPDGGEHAFDLGEQDLALGRVDLQAHTLWRAPRCRIASISCSKPPVSRGQWMPHSLGAFVSHHQRPARASSPSAVARVQGAQPMLV